MALICVPLIERTIEKDVSLANLLDCDLVEVRLDYLGKAAGIEKLGRIRKPVIATCMPSWEGGLFAGSEEDRFRLLESCLPYSSYVTVELKAALRLRQRLVENARKKKVKVIVASHDFKGTPGLDAILGIIAEEEKAGADISKVAFTANSSGDVLTLMRALVEGRMRKPVIALSMGEKGRIGRVIGPYFGSYLAFASSKESRKSAPGQIPLAEMKKLMEYCR